VIDVLIRHEGTSSEQTGNRPDGGGISGKGWLRGSAESVEKGINTKIAIKTSEEILIQTFIIMVPPKIDLDYIYVNESRLRLLEFGIKFHGK
jgi:hypothetical protein